MNVYYSIGKKGPNNLENVLDFLYLFLQFRRSLIFLICARCENDWGTVQIVRFYYFAFFWSLGDTDVQ